MPRQKFTIVSLATLIALILTVGFGVVPAKATHVEPVFEGGNPTCADLAPDGTTWVELKIEPVSTGVYSDGVLTVNITVYDTDTGQVFDWSSNIGIDSVFAKGGPGGNLYIYDPPATEDTGLHAPLGAGPGGSKYFGLSHISFCYSPALVVSKNAQTTFTRTFGWTINKSVTPETWDLFTGDSGTSEYTVEVTKDGGTDSGWAVSGNITIYNPHSSSATITGVTDLVNGTVATVNCPVVGFPYELAAGGTLICPYSASLSDGSPRTNTATVTTSGAIDGGTATADVIFGDPTTVVNDSINVDDTYAGDLGSFNDSGSVSYSRTFTCDDDEGEHDNTATIVEIEQSDDASVVVTCYALIVTKDAETFLTRSWEWNIEKSGDQSELTLATGQTFEVNYDVTVSALSTDSDWAASGDIEIYNPAPQPATINDVVDEISDFGLAAVDCGVTFPYELPAGGTLTCSYSADLPDADDRTNTATATLQNYDYDFEGNATAAGTTDFNGNADVSFDEATVDEVDECIDVSDDQFEDLGTVCANDAPYTFEYSLNVGPYAECGEYEFTNIASFVTNDTETEGSDSWIVVIDVPCVGFGCTLTPGYWKTHSKYGPAPYDNTWAQIGEDTTFFLSGKSYYQVLWTPPAGNAYYNLAFHYIAAKLNMLNEATAPADVQAAFDQATALFNTYTPAQIAALKGNNSVRKQFIDLAAILAAYNEGALGPGHCDDDQNTAGSGISDRTEGTEVVVTQFIFIPLSTR